MATKNNYSKSIKFIDGLMDNTGEHKFPLVDARDIYVDDTHRLSNETSGSPGALEMIEADLATTYDASVSYIVGDYCLYDHQLYRCTTAGANHTPAAGSSYWTATNVMAEAGSGVGNSIAAAFATNKTYTVGDYVVYQRKLYRCTSAVETAGDWTGTTNWTEAILADDVADLKSAVSDINDVLFGESSSNFTVGKNLDSNGALVDAPNVCVSEKIPCSTWTGYARFYCNDNTTTDYAICYYDSSDTLLKKFQNPSVTGSSDFRNINIDTQVTGDPAYVRFSFKKNTTGKVTDNANPPTTTIWEAVSETGGGIADIENASVGDVGKALSPATVIDNKVTSWQYVDAGLNDYADLDNKPSINGVTLSGNKSLSDIGAASDESVADINDILYGESSVNYTVGKNLDSSGALVDAPNVCVSEKIPCSTWSGYSRFYCNDNTTTDYAICYYNSSDTLLNRFKNPSNTGSIEYRNIDIGTQVTGTPAYVRFSFKANTVGKVTDNASPPTVEKWVAREEVTDGLVDAVENNSDICQKTKILLGTDSISAETASLSANTALKLDDAPWFIMKNQGVSARVKFSAFTSLSVGKGHMNYRGRWITIDDTYVHIYSTLDDLTGVREYDANGKYNGQAGYAGPSAHGLTISDFIEVSMYETVDGKISTNIDTLSGSFSLNIVSNYWWNYAPFIMGEQAMTDVKIGYSCSDIRSPLWMFGDSYLGIAANRVGGQLMNAGFTSYLMDGIAGGRAVHDATPGKSISGDLNKLLAMGTPKYIVWTLGMNGTISMNTDYIDTLKALCETKGITLILYMVPSVPNNDKTDLNTYIAGTNLRYINAYDAVGANAQGEWYTGFLSDDNVHPSILGAKAIAMRYLADVPELMQYGYSTGNVDGESDDGNEI